MAKVITDGKTKIGAYKVPRRKKICLCVDQGNEIITYGTFINEESAEDFMDRLADFVGAEKEGVADET